MKSKSLGDGSDVGRDIAVLELDPLGVRAAVARGGAEVAFSPESGWPLPRSLLSVVHDQLSPDVVPFFPALLERLGENRELTLEGMAPGRPSDLLQALLLRLTSALQNRWGQLADVLGFVVPNSLGEPQKARIVKAAEQAGWARARLINRTTALAFHALRDREPGTFLALILGYGPADCSIVRWQSGQLQAVNHVSSPQISEEQLDRRLLALAWQRMDLAPGPYTDPEWLAVRRRVESIRGPLRVAPQVSVQLAVDDQVQEAVLGAEDWLRCQRPVAQGLGELIRQCCTGAGVRSEDLDGYLVAGDIFQEPAFLGELQGFSQRRSLRWLPAEGALLGACRMLSRELGREVAEGTGIPRLAGTGPPGEGSDRPVVRLDASRSSPAETVDLGAWAGRITASIEHAESLIAGGDMARLQSELGLLKQAIRYLGVSPDGAAAALQTLAPGPLPAQARTAAGSRSQPEAAEPTPGSETRTPEEQTGPVATVGSEEEKERRARRRKYVLAKGDLKTAQAALRRGQFELAVRHGHLAYKTSADPRIFEAMIKVHLLAASKRPPEPGNFHEESRWLICALNDDGTNERVQSAIAERYLVHAQQLSEMSTREAHLQAEATLEDLLHIVPMVDQARAWLEELRAGRRGDVRLVREDRK